MFASKTRCAVKGYSLDKRCGAAREHRDGALRVSLSAPMFGMTPFAKEITIARNTDKLIKSTN
jgi:hypothetical protein